MRRVRDAENTFQIAGSRCEHCEGSELAAEDYRKYCTVQDTSTLRMGLTYRCEDAAGLTQSLVASQQAGQEVLGQLGVLTHKQPE